MNRQSEQARQYVAAVQEVLEYTHDLVRDIGEQHALDGTALIEPGDETLVELKRAMRVVDQMDRENDGD